jgi:hypothetical protein
MEKGKWIQQKQQPKIKKVVDNEELKNWTTLPLKENKIRVYIELLETDVWIQKLTSQQNLLLRKIVRKWTKWTNNWYWQNITNIWTYLAKKRHTVSPNQDLEITKSKWRNDLNLKLQPHTSRTNWTGQILKGKPQKRVYLDISIANGLSVFLRLQKGWQTSTMSGLPVFKRLDGQKFLFLTTCFGNNGQT